MFAKDRAKVAFVVKKTAKHLCLAGIILKLCLNPSHDNRIIIVAI